MWALLDEKGGAPWALDRVVNGATLRDLAEELGVSRNLLSTELNKHCGAELKDARAQAASVHAEEALRIADYTTPRTSGQID